LVQREEVMPPIESRPYFALDAPQLAGGVADRLLPRDLAPLVTDALADHRLDDPVGVCGVTVGETALDARVSVVGATVTRRSHAHHLHVRTLAAQFRLQAAADAAVGAGRAHGALRRP